MVNTSYQEANSCVAHGICQLQCLSVYFAEFQIILTQMVISEHTSFSLHKVDVNDFILQTPMVVAQPYVTFLYYLILLCYTCLYLFNAIHNIG